MNTLAKKAAAVAVSGATVGTMMLMGASSVFATESNHSSNSNHRQYSNSNWGSKSSDWSKKSDWKSYDNHKDWKDDKKDYHSGNNWNKNYQVQYSGYSNNDWDHSERDYKRYKNRDEYRLIYARLADMHKNNRYEDNDRSYVRSVDIREVIEALRDLGLNKGEIEWVLKRVGYSDNDCRWYMDNYDSNYGSSQWYSH